MPEKLSVDELYKCCNQDIFKFKTTDDLPLFEETIGQERALRALDFGIGFNNRGFNIFILGERDRQDDHNQVNTVKTGNK